MAEPKEQDGLFDDDKNNDVDVSPERDGGPTRAGKKKKRSTNDSAAAAVAGKRGVCYLSRVPPRMEPFNLRQILSRYGEVQRIFLTREGSASSQVSLHGAEDPYQAPSPTTSSEDDEMAQEVIKAFYSILKVKLPGVLNRNAAFGPVKAIAECQVAVLESIAGYEERANALRKVLADLEDRVARFREASRRSPTSMFLEEDAALVAAIEEEAATFQARKEALAKEISELADQYEQFNAASQARISSKDKLAAHITEKYNQIARLYKEIAHLEANLRAVVSEHENYTAQAVVTVTTSDQLKEQLVKLEEEHARLVPFRDETTRQEEARRRAVVKSHAEVAALRDSINQLCIP